MLRRWASSALYALNVTLRFFTSGFTPFERLFSPYVVALCSLVLLEHHRTRVDSCGGTPQESSDTLYQAFCAYMSGLLEASQDLLKAGSEASPMRYPLSGTLALHCGRLPRIRMTSLQNGVHKFFCKCSSFVAFSCVSECMEGTRELDSGAIQFSSTLYLLFV